MLNGFRALVALFSLYAALWARADDTAAPKAFVPVDTSVLMGSPEPPLLFEVEVAFPNLRFPFPVDITHAGDGTDRVFVVSQGGRIYVFPNRRDIGEKKVFLDLRRVVARVWFEQGLLALAFHPNFRENGQFFVYYSVEPLATRLSRFQVSQDDPDKADPSSEEKLLEIPQPFWNHNSGSLKFGPDGFLYVALGDGGDANDPHGNGQNAKSYLGSVLRIDVDRRDPEKGYAVPPDNPFVGRADVLPEIWALGLRNPWKMCFDRETGTLWLADVGQNLWEEVNVIARGGNYGWRVREGRHPFDPDAERFSDDYVAPVWEYHHSEGRSITGGVLYRGKRHPKIRGWYLCADWMSGNIWGLRWNGKRVEESRKIAPRLTGISAFGEDEAGEVYFTAQDALAPIRAEETVYGRVYHFQPALKERRHKVFPRQLSKTGLFASVKDHTPNAGLIPYDVNVPLWSDGAAKDRYLALPEKGKVVFHEEGNWEFPVGTVIVKTFGLDMVRGEPASRRRLETRLMVHSPRGWVGYTYIWNDEQTDATLLDGFREAALRIRTPQGDREQTWYFPSRTDCMTCHAKIKAGVLGLNTRQLNRAHVDGGRNENQLRRLENLGVFTKPLPKDPYALEAYPDWAHGSAPVEALARSYLDVNCSVCHAPGGEGLSQIDLRFHTPLTKTRLLFPHRLPSTEPGELAPVIPGDPTLSPLVTRMKLRERRDPSLPGPMPPLATHLPDERALETIRRWIREMRSD